MKTLTKQQIIEVLKKHNVICASASREQLAAELESLQEVDINTPFFGNSGATVPMKEESKDESRMSAEDVLKKYAKEHPRKYESFVALIENESAIDVYDFILMAMLRFASQGKDVTDEEIECFAKHETTIGNNDWNYRIGKRVGYVEGAKAHRDGLIPHKD